MTYQIVALAIAEEGGSPTSPHIVTLMSQLLEGIIFAFFFFCCCAITAKFN